MTVLYFQKVRGIPPIQAKSRQNASLKENIEEILGELQSKFINEAVIRTSCGKLVIKKCKNKQLPVTKNENEEVVYEKFNKLTLAVTRKCESHIFAILALDLWETQFRFLKRIIHSYEGKEKLRILLRLSELAFEVTKKLQKQKKGDHFKKKYSTMDQILDEMEDVGTIEDINEKCEQVSRCFLNYAQCCSNVEDYGKSLEIVNHAVHIMKTVYGEKSNHRRLLALCYKSAFVVRCHEPLKDKQKAENWKKKALETSDKVEDWKKIKEKEDFENSINKTFKKSFPEKRKIPQNNSPPTS